jgi:hypothetical protein
MLPNFKALIFANVDILITIWLVKFEFEVVISVCIDQSTTCSTAWVSGRYHAMDSSFFLHIGWRCYLSHYMTALQFLFSTPVYQRLSRCDTTLHFQGRNSFVVHIKCLIILFWYYSELCQLNLAVLWLWALSYEPEGRGFDSRRDHWIFNRPNPYILTMALGST